MAVARSQRKRQQPMKSCWDWTHNNLGAAANRGRMGLMSICGKVIGNKQLGRNSTPRANGFNVILRQSDGKQTNQRMNQVVSHSHEKKNDGALKQRLCCHALLCALAVKRKGWRRCAGHFQTHTFCATKKAFLSGSRKETVLSKWYEAKNEIHVSCQRIFERTFCIRSEKGWSCYVGENFERIVSLVICES